MTEHLAKREESHLLDAIASWIGHVREHGVTTEQIQAALGMDASAFLRFIERDFCGGLERLTRLRPGAEAWQVLREVQEFAGVEP